MMRRVFLGMILLLVGPVSAQVRHEIRIPDPAGCVVLKCDFHMHTVFSDGLVWPTVRVEEAWREGLDAIAITDHLEYRPRREDVVGNVDRPYAIVETLARRKNILLVRGAEITRDTPPGHFNALFTQDNEAMNLPDLDAVFAVAARQNAFVMWNHPGWQGPERGRWGEVQAGLLEKGGLHAIEICNGEQYYVDAHRMALEHNLTLMGSSDIHEPAPTAGQIEAGHRTMTLVLARERSLAALREAMNTRRTVVWWKDRLIGRSAELAALLNACLQVDAPHEQRGDQAMVVLRNRGEVGMQLELDAVGRTVKANLPAHSAVLVELPAPAGELPGRITCRVLNWLVDVETPFSQVMTIPAAATSPAD